MTHGMVFAAGRVFQGVAWLLVGGLTAVAVAADSPAVQNPAELLPPTTVLYGELTGVSELLPALLDHPLRHKFDSLDQVRAAYEKKPYLDLKAGVAIVESQLGKPWRKIVSEVAGGGAVIAIDAKTEGVAVLVRAENDTAQQKLLDVLVTLARADATEKGKPDPIKTGEHRGQKAYKIDKSTLVVFDRWLVLSNKGDLLKAIVDIHLDRPAETLATSEPFRAARAQRPSGAAAWGWVHSEALREAGVAKKLYSGRTENPLAEVLFGGIASTLQHAPYITAALTGSARHATVTVSTPYDPSWAGETREYYFGPEGKGTAPQPLKIPDTLLSLRAYRDISGMWVRAGDLFDENTNDELAKADSNLSTLFGGKDFGEDILGSFAPEMRFMVTRQEFAAGQPQPAIKLPAFAFVFQLKDPEKMQPELRRTFQSLIGFLNVIGAMNNQPQLDLDMEKSEGAQLVTSTYLIDDKQKDLTAMKLHYNFSPSVAFAGERMVISSTKELARQLATATAEQEAPAGGNSSQAGATKADPFQGTQVNTGLTLQFDPLRAVLADNRGQLVAQNMLQEGHTKEEAEAAVDVLLELVEWLDTARLQLGTRDEQLTLSVTVTLDEVPAAGK